MRDLKSSRLMVAKALLFLLMGGMAGGLLLLEAGSWRAAALLGICVWAFCRAYYFAFYVIEHWIDPRFRFSGLGSVLRYWWTGRGKD
ncbi:MAG: hypothetical protein KDK99_21150 [Verrucomicrobiales bacterium]|nr:hypothetical protein [Verrucomicrobiales bacterium]